MSMELDSLKVSAKELKHPPGWRMALGMAMAPPATRVRSTEMDSEFLSARALESAVQQERSRRPRPPVPALMAVPQYVAVREAVGQRDPVAEPRPPTQSEAAEWDQPSERRQRRAASGRPTDHR